MNIIEANRHHIEAALEYSGGTHSYADIEASILSGKMQIWPAPNGCAITEIIQYPQKKVFHVFLYAGELAQMLDMDASAVAWAKAQGCESMSFSGRMGWQRVMQKHGFAPKLVTMTRDI